MEAFALSGCYQGQPMRRGPAHFSMESPWDGLRLPGPLYAAIRLGASESEPCHHPLQRPWAKPFRDLCQVKAQLIHDHALSYEGGILP